MPEVLSEEVTRAIANLITTNNIIAALKLYRTFTGSNLEEAKIFVEKLRMNLNLPQLAQVSEWQVPANTPQAQTFLLQYIIQQWNGLNQDMRPQGVWIRQHTSLASKATEIMTPVAAVWFLDYEGIQQESLWTYARFHTVHFEQPWCTGTFKKPFFKTKLSGRTYEIGFTAFATYCDNNDACLEFTWGPLFGRGFRVAIGRTGQVYEIERLWIS